MIPFYVVWAGIAEGILYGLIGLSYFLIFRATRALSFAVGGSVGVAGMAAAGWTFTSPVVSAVLAIGLAVVVTLATDVFVARFVQSRQVAEFGTALALAAALFVMTQVSGLVFTQNTVLGRPLVGGNLHIASQSLTTNSVITVFGGLLVATGMAIWLRHGRRGRLLAALGDNAEAARKLCLPVKAVRLLAVALAGCAAGIAGVLYVGAAPMSVQTFLEFSLDGFLAVVIGGTASPWGPLCGGLLLAAVATLGAQYISGSSQDYLFLVVVLVMFRLRPRGIFAAAVRDWD